MAHSLFKNVNCETRGIERFLTSRKIKPSFETRGNDIYFTSRVQKVNILTFRDITFYLLSVMVSLFTCNTGMRLTLNGMIFYLTKQQSYKQTLLHKFPTLLFYGKGFLLRLLSRISLLTLFYHSLYYSLKRHFKFICCHTLRIILYMSNLVLKTVT